MNASKVGSRAAKVIRLNALAADFAIISVGQMATQRRVYSSRCSEGRIIFESSGTYKLERAEKRSENKTAQKTAVDITVQTRMWLGVY